MPVAVVGAVGEEEACEDTATCIGWDGGRAIALIADVNDPDAMVGVVERTTSELGAPTVLVTCRDAGDALVAATEPHFEMSGWGRVVTLVGDTSSDTDAADEPGAPVGPAGPAGPGVHGVGRDELGLPGVTFNVIGGVTMHSTVAVAPIVHAVEFFVSESAGAITGQVLRVTEGAKAPLWIQPAE